MRTICLAFAPILALTLEITGCVGTAVQTIEPQPPPSTARLSVTYDHTKNVSIINVKGVIPRRMGIWYPGRLEYLDSPPYQIRPEAEFVRFNFSYDILTDRGVVRSWVMLTEHTQIESPSLFPSEISLTCSSNVGCNFLLDMRPLIAPPK